MLNLIKADFYRILKGKALYIAILAIIAMFTLSIIAMSPGHLGLASVSEEFKAEVISNDELNQKLKDTDSLTETRNIMKEYGSFQLDKQIIGTNVNLYYIFIIIVAIVLTTDFSNSTIKNTLSSAISRRKYYGAKLITCLLLCTILIVINNYGMYVVNFFVNGPKFVSSLWDITKLTLIQLPLLYGIISLLLCISSMTRKTATFNSVSIPFLILFQMIVLGVTSLFHLNSTTIMNYELQYALANLSLHPTNSYILHCILLGVAYMVVFNAIGYSFFRKAEIK